MTNKKILFSYKLKMKDIFRIIKREWGFLKGRRLYLAALIVFPLADCIFLGGIYASGMLEKMPAAVIDNDNSKLSRTIVRYFNASPDIDIRYRLSNVREMKELFERDKISLGIYIPKGTEKNIKRQKPQTIVVFTNAANYITGNITSIDAATIIGTVGAGIKYKTLAKRGFSSNQAKTLIRPMQNDSARLFNPALNYNFYLTPGLWLAVLHQLLILAGTLTLSGEYDFRTVRRMKKIAGNSVFKALLGKTLMYVLIAMLHFEILYRAIFPLFDIPIVSTVLAAEILSLFVSLAGVSLGLMLAAIFKNRLDSLKACLLISAPAFLFSGYTWPVAQMPKPLAYFVQLIPLTPFIEAFRKIYQQDLGIEFTYPFVIQLAVLAVIFFGVTAQLVNNRLNDLKDFKVLKDLNKQKSARIRD
ncbi:MAG: ABC transporter permease [Endomicrobia bacterium]|nr:ABC transporter permease [Endomicrobiia bacterium]